MEEENVLGCCLGEEEEAGLERRAAVVTPSWLVIEFAEWFSKLLIISISIAD